MIGAVVVLLGCAKLMRLQEELTGALRGAAQSSGFYDLHRQAQGAFALIVGLLAVAGAIVLTHRLRHRSAALGAAVIALEALLVMLAVRAASIHVVDAWTTAEFAGMRQGWWLEAAVAAVIAACAVAYRRSESS